MFHPDESGVCVVLCVTSLGKSAFAKALADKTAFAKALVAIASTPRHLVVR